MKEWKVRQEVYHRLNQYYADQYGPDDIEMMEHVDTNSIIETVAKYLSGWVPEKVVYPAKSYFVALVYSRLLRDHFQEDPFEALSDQDLLYGNDPYFQAYGQTSENDQIYDSIIQAFGWDFDLSLGEIPDVADYFREEFMLDQDA
jgi:hypothetical protein